MEKRIWRLFILAATVVLVAVDQITKVIADSVLIENTIVLIPGVFELRHTTNDGIAFGLLSGYRWIFITLTVLLMAVLAAVLLSGRLKRFKTATAAGIFILAGGIGNLIDRVFRGEVVDFFYFKLIKFPIFNVADCFVVIGSAILVLFVLFVYRDDQPLKKKEGEPDNGAENADSSAGDDGGETG